MDSCIRYISLTDSALFQVYIFLIVSFLAWFLYNVHSNEAGQPVYFLCTPTFWRKLFGLKVFIFIIYIDIVLKKLMFFSDRFLIRKMLVE